MVRRLVVVVGMLFASLAWGNSAEAGIFCHRQTSCCSPCCYSPPCCAVAPAAQFPSSVDEVLRAMGIDMSRLSESQRQALRSMPTSQIQALQALIDAHVRDLHLPR
jgi:hypothetical protein